MKWAKHYASLPASQDVPYVNWQMDFLWSEIHSNMHLYNECRYDEVTEKTINSVAMEIADGLLNDAVQFLRFFKSPVHWLASRTDFPRTHNPLSNKHFCRILAELASVLSRHVDGSTLTFSVNPYASGGSK